jgi:hypothetical protein
MYWINGNIDEAEATLEQAFQAAGTPGPYAKETPWRRAFFGNSYLMKAALLAEKGSCQKALEWIGKATDYRRNKRERGVLGYVSLLVARACTSATEGEVALEAAEKYLQTGDRCLSCRYNLACVLARRSELSEGKDREKLILEAKDYILDVLENLTDNQMEPEIEIIKCDPFLKAVVSLKVVRDALADFYWDPKDEVEQEQLPEELWNFGVPLKRVRFTRLNGDPR